jgi:hypothetical protein
MYVSDQIHVGVSISVSLVFSLLDFVYILVCCAFFLTGSCCINWSFTWFRLFVGLLGVFSSGFCCVYWLNFVSLFHLFNVTGFVYKIGVLGFWLTGFCVCI